MMMAWEAAEKGLDCNDCYLSMQNCHDKSICCEDETGLNQLIGRKNDD